MQKYADQVYTRVSPVQTVYWVMVGETRVDSTVFFWPAVALRTAFASDLGWAMVGQNVPILSVAILRASIARN